MNFKPSEANTDPMQKAGSLLALFQNEDGTYSKGSIPYLIIYVPNTILH